MRPDSVNAKALLVGPLLAATLCTIGLAIMAVSGGCSGRQKTLRASLVAVDAARDGFVEWDKQHQLQIVEKATSKEEGRAKLDEYRTNREPIITGFEVVYRAIALAATREDDASLRDALDRAEKLFQAVTRLKGGP